VNKPSFKKADDFIEFNARDLKTVFTKINLLAQLNTKILACLEPNMAKYCQVANLVGSKLTLIAANGSIATQIRFQAQDLIKKFHQYPILKSILFLECKVRPAQSQLSSRLTTNTTSSMTPLTPETGEMICAMAETIEDEKLREIMVRIGKRIEGKE
jgi:hypothetical protein